MRYRQPSPDARPLFGQVLLNTFAHCTSVLFDKAGAYLRGKLQSFFGVAGCVASYV